MHSRTLLHAGLGLLLVGSIASCRRLNHYDQSRWLEESRDQWSETIARQGLVPVFPPREDVQVGDIYVYTFNPESPAADADGGENSYGLNPGRWMQVKNIQAMLKEEYQTRPTFRETPGIPGLTPGYGNDVINEGGSLRRLRIVSFPDFVGATLRDSRSSLQKSMVHNGIIPAEVFDLNQDPIALDISMVSLKIPAAESYAISQNELVNEMIDQSGETKRLKAPYKEGARWAAHRKRLWLRVVTEVYFARNLDITIEYKDHPTVEPHDGYRMVAPDPAIKVKERVRILNDALHSIGAQNIPGGTLRYINSTDHRVALRRTWERGVAIGIRGFTLEIDPSSGDVLHLHPLNSFNPSFRPRVL